MSDFSKLSDQLAIATTEIQRKKQQIESSKRTLKLYEIHIQNQKAKIKSLEAENKKLKQKTEQTKRLQRILADNRVIIKKYKDKILALEQQNAENEKEINEGDSLTESLDWSGQLSSIKKSVEELKQSKYGKGDLALHHINLDDDIDLSSQIQFYQGVNLQGENQSPTSHRKIFSMINEYFQKLMPSFKISFLNMLAADVEDKLDRIHDFSEEMEGFWEQ